MAAVSLIPVNSSAIRAVGYDGDTLAIVFTTNDTVYYYHGVPYSIYAGLMEVKSKGTFYNRHISGRYQ